MKKLMIVLVALMAVISFAHAEFGDRETIVIKDGNTVRIFHSKDVTRESYSWEEFEITSYNCTNISASELKSLEVPEGAWKLCSSSESGVYSTKEAKLATENKELNDTNYDLETENQDLESDNSNIKIAVFGFGCSTILFLILALVYIDKLSKEKRRKTA